MTRATFSSFSRRSIIVGVALAVGTVIVVILLVTMSSNLGANTAAEPPPLPDNGPKIVVYDPLGEKVKKPSATKSTGGDSGAGRWHPDRHVNFNLDERVVEDDDAALLRANLPETRLNEVAGYPLQLDSHLQAVDPRSGAQAFKNEKQADAAIVVVDAGKGDRGEDFAEPAKLKKDNDGAHNDDENNKNNNHNKDKEQSLPTTCPDATNCLQCLFRTHAPLSCAWLASRGLCVPARMLANEYRNSADAETDFCPAILHRGLPCKINVIHVAIRKGGPEALIQLHLALAYWGFRTHLDSRKSKKTKGGPIVPFFLDVYSAEFARVSSPAATAAGDDNSFRAHFKDYEDWQASGKEGEVLVATETWPCTNARTEQGPAFINGANRDDLDFNIKGLLAEPAELRRRGVRYAQWHLTVWPTRDRSVCTIMAHTRYIASEYMKTPLLALLFPYVSPHIVRLSKKKTPVQYELLKAQAYRPPLVMYDGDVKSLLPSVLQNPTKGMEFTVKRASGYTPEKLYEEYGKSTVCVDWELPGGERFIYESALFGCCPIVDRSLNGLDAEDFPLPRYLRVSPTKTEWRQLAARLHREVDSKHSNHPENAAVTGSVPRSISGDVIPTLAMAIGYCADDSKRKETMRALMPMRAAILHQRVRFHKHVRRYFSNSVHVVTAVASADEFETFAVRFILATLAHVPFATIEFLLTKQAALGVPRVQSQLEKLRKHSYLAAVLWTVCRPPERSGGQPYHHDPDHEMDSTTFLGSILAQGTQFVTTNRNRVAFVAFVPVDHVINSRAFVHYLGSLLALSDSEWQSHMTRDAQRAARNTDNGNNKKTNKAANFAIHTSQVIHGIFGDSFVFLDSNSLQRLNPDMKESTCAELGMALSNKQRLLKIIAASSSSPSSSSLLTSTAASRLQTQWFDAMGCPKSLSEYDEAEHNDHQQQQQQQQQQQGKREKVVAEVRALKSVEEVEAESVLNPEKRLVSNSKVQLVASDAAVPRSTMEFLCAHALFVDMFSSKCRFL